MSVCNALTAFPDHHDWEMLRYSSNRLSQEVTSKYDLRHRLLPPVLSPGHVTIVTEFSRQQH
jgi:hypothetical protein